MGFELSQEELDERVAIVKRFRSLLEQQRSKFREYLVVLESQHGKIEVEDGASLEAHAALGNQIVENIASLQKVIVPMQSLYEKKVRAGGKNAASEKSIVVIQNDLDDLRKKVLAQNEKNRALLQTRLSQVKSQLNSMSKINPYFGNRSVYSDRGTVGGMISISG